MITDSVRKLEGLAKKISGMKILLYIGIGVVLLAVIRACTIDGAYFLLGLFDPAVIGMLLIGVGIICVAFSTKKSALFEFKRTFKNEIVLPELENKFQDVDYDWRGCLSGGTLTETGLIEMGDKVTGEDLIKATYNGRRFEQSDVLVVDQGEYENTEPGAFHLGGSRIIRGRQRKQTDRGKGKLFCGRVIKVCCNRKDVFSVQLFTKDYTHRGKPLERYAMKKVNLESLEFNKVFDVYASSEEEAFYYLTPQYMEKLLQLAKEYGTIGVHASDGFLYVAIKQSGQSAMNAFDVKDIENIDFYEIRQKLAKDVELICKLVDLAEYGPVTMN